MSPSEIDESQLAERPVYLDNQSTTRVDPRVVAAMLPCFDSAYGNAASGHHSFGREAAACVAAARESIARLLHVEASSIIFTSGATESNNLALKGIFGNSCAGRHLLVSAVEHRSVLDAARRLKRRGLELTIVPVDRWGRVDPQVVATAIRPETSLVSIMLANNEVGTINPIREIGEICRRHGVLLHCDAVQGLGSISIDLPKLNVDLASFSAHKVYGPKGVGALYVRRGDPPVRLEPLFDGGGHERRLRSGTLPVPAIVGFGVACDLLHHDLAAESIRIQSLRDRLWQGLQRRIANVVLNGHPTDRISGNLHVSFPRVDGERLLQNLTKVAASSGSACSSADPEPSHVLQAMGISESLSKASLRLSVGRFNTSEEIDLAIEHLVEVVEQLQYN